MPGKDTAASPAVENEPAVVDPAAEVVVEPSVADEPDANAADPSTAEIEGAKEPASLLDVIRSAVEQPVEPEASPAPEGEQEEPVVEEPAVAAEPEAADDADLPFHNHPRWKAVIAERDSLREPAERMNLIQGFMQEKGLTNEEVAEGYRVMGLLKGSPEEMAEARTWFAERLGGLDEALGNVLPEDLRTRVDEGLLDEAGATELARARAAAALRAAADERTTAATAAEIAARDATERRSTLEGAVEAWETRIKASDPDYPKKAKLVLDRCMSITRLEGKVPTTAEEATALADRALAEISAEFTAALPKPRPIVPSPAGSSTTAAAAPTTLRAAIDAAVSR